MSPSPALVVEPLFSDVLLLVPILSALGFEITATENFEEARQSLRVPPRLLITEIRLGEFNGLHLVLRGRSVRPDMAAIVTTTIDDPVLRHEAEIMGATFVLKPATADELQAAILRTVLRREPTPIRGPFERRHGDRRVIVPAGLLPERRRADRRADPRVRLAEVSMN